MVDDDVRSASTLTEMMRRRAVRSPDQQYFRLYDETVTYGRLWEQSGRYAAGLARAGVGPGDKICLIYPTCAEFFYTFFGALRVGAVPVPLYPTLGVETTAAIFRDSEAIAVATIGWFRTGVDESCALAPNVRMVLEPPDLEIDAPAPPLVEARPDDLAFLQYTSGSTGHPRGVMLTHQNVVSTIHFMAEAAGITVDDRVVSWLPLYHDMGLIGCAFTPPLLPTPIWLLPPDLRNPRQWLTLITEIRATFTVSPDFGYRNCVRNVRDTTGIDLGSLKAALSGPSPCGRRRSRRSNRTSASSASSRRATAWPRPPSRSPSGRAACRFGSIRADVFSPWASPAAASPSRSWRRWTKAAASARRESKARSASRVPV
jgi:acyl-CoA synthetase (AMP-forming)/AMP-acid ligase II